MQDYKPSIRQYLTRLGKLLAELDDGQIDAVANVLRDAYQRQKTIFLLGNGGSAATASHLAADLNKGACLKAGKKFRVIPLTDCVAWISAIANDLDYESIFVEPLKNFAAAGDVVMGISGSGNSPNVLRAIEYANDVGCTTIGVCGYDGGKLKPLVDYCFHAEIDDMQLAEDAHMVLVHILRKLLYTEDA